ncbi:glycosyltransferase [Exiguobacterium undae]|uniref:Glycosyl transferase family 1 domain-containing protein n=1 Tax=Exiguobacterium undae TaxID=169177 RepID=A0ABX2V949_9BACL|nr:glycosyltransferase [Exiguobacterium undae]OAN14369.1 hypothetical protein A3783_00145 [Exiguobacterium undae]
MKKKLVGENNELEILYVAPYVDEKVKEFRGYGSLHPAGNKKIVAINNLFKKNNWNSTIISPLLLKKNTFKIFKSKKIFLNESLVIFPTTIDVKFLSLIFNLVFSLYELSKWAKSNKHKRKVVVFYNYRVETSIVALFAKTFFKIPIIIDYEDGIYAVKETNKYYRKLSLLIEKMMDPLLNGAVLVTSLLKQRVATNNVVVARGIYNSTSDTPSQNFIKECANLTYTGRLDYERGIEVLLESLKYIETEKKINLRISGYGPIQKKVEDFITENTLKDINIEFLGFLNDSDYNELMISTDIFINPQRETIKFNECSFPSKVFEYAKHSKLIISSNVSDVKEMSENSIVLYENDCPQNLGNAISEAIDQYNEISSDFPINLKDWMINNSSETVLSEKMKILIEVALKGEKNA